MRGVGHEEEKESKEKGESRRHEELGTPAAMTCRTLQCELAAGEEGELVGPEVMGD